MSTTLNQTKAVRPTIIGQRHNRVEGPLKVTGAADYVGDIPIAGVVHGRLIQSTIPKGHVTKIDTAAAEAVPGFIGVLTHTSMPKLSPVQLFPAGGAGQRLLPLQDDTIYYNGQHIGLLVAETLEAVEQAAGLVKVTYAEDTGAVTAMRDAMSQAYPPHDILGAPPDSLLANADTAFAEAKIKVDHVYTTPNENHNPMETHVTIALWNEADQLTVYEPTQWLSGVREYVATAFGMPKEKVRVISHFTGGSFGCKTFVWPHTLIAIAAAKQFGHPVKVTLTRAQMSTSVGYRPETHQRIALASQEDGKLVAIIHEGTTQTAMFDDYVEPVGWPTSALYTCPNIRIQHRLVRANAGMSTWMRAPGEAPGSFALESAMDELAYELKMDPLTLRLRNYADTDPFTGQPWSSKALKACYQQGAEHFGWQQRQLEPSSRRDGHHLIGWGMATAIFLGFRSPAAARATLFADGTALGQSGTHEIGNGVTTVMSQILAETLGLPFACVRFKLGDTSLPEAPITGVSNTTGSVGEAVRAAALAVQRKVIDLALADPISPLYRAQPEQIVVEDGRLFLRDNAAQKDTYSQLLQRHHLDYIEEELNVTPSEDGKHYSIHSYGAHFVEVRVDKDLGVIRVSRYVGAFDGGRIINPQTAQSQAIGGIVGGIGMALTEHTLTDHKTGGILSANLSQYLVPVNADIPRIDAFYVDNNDPHINSLGAKGVGEIGLVGVAGAIANAVFHATGKRVRDLPITLNQLL